MSIVAPRIDRNALKDIRVKAGQPIEFEVPVQGEPPPTKKWTLNDNPVGTNAKIDNEDYKTNFAIKNAQRGDSGVLALTVSNPNGTDTVRVNVIVMGTSNTGFVPSHSSSRLVLYFNMST